MNKAAYLLPTAYFPNLEYMTVLLRGAKQQARVWVEAEEFYVKQTYRNRTYILGSQQVESLSVPVIGGTKKVKIRDIKLDNRQSWQRLHWRSLQAAYGKSPFWEHYAPQLEPIFQQTFTYLWDLNQKALTSCLQLLGMEPTTTYTPTSAYKKDVGPYCRDLRSCFRPGIDYSERELYFAKTYVQVFGVEFAENLSILDLLFCQGPGAAAVLQHSIRQS